MLITITKMERPERSGDWHDKPLRYKVCGPDNEVQKFSIKKDALAYRADRRRSTNQAEACNRWVAR